MAEHLEIDHLRHSRRRQERFTLVNPEEAARIAVAPDVATVYTYREALYAVDAALQAMPARSREIFLADRLDGTSHQALAEHLTAVAQFPATGVCNDRMAVSSCSFRARETDRVVGQLVHICSTWNGAKSATTHVEWRDHTYVQWRMDHRCHAKQELVGLVMPR